MKPKNLIQWLVMSLLFLTSTHAHAWRLYLHNTKDYEIQKIYFTNQDTKNIEIINFENKNLVLNSLYSYKYQGSNIPDIISYDTTAGMYETTTENKNFIPGYVISRNFYPTTQTLSSYATWKLIIDNNEGFSVEEIILAEDKNYIWSKSVELKSKSESYKLSFQYKISPSASIIYDGDILSGTKGQVLSTKSDPVVMVSDYTEAGQGEAISAEHLTPGCTYKFTWDALNETLSVELVSGTEEGDSGNGETPEPQSTYNYFKADQTDWVIKSVYSNNEGMDLSECSYKIVPDFDPVTDPGREKSNLPSYIYDQMTLIHESNPYLHIDGYYNEDVDVELVASNDNPSEFDLKINSLPCSGLYKLVITPQDGGETQEISVPIYPDVFNQYATNLEEDPAYTLNVNGIPVTINEKGELTLDYLIVPKESNNGESSVGNELWMEKQLSKSAVYTPGLYLPEKNDKLYIWVEYNPITSENGEVLGEEGPRRSAPDSDKYEEYNESLDLSALKQLYDNKGDSSDSMRLHFVVSKNGVTTPFDEETSQSDQSVGVSFTEETPTGVTEIEEDNAPAIYYNLQGIRVENLTRGIYIKVQGQKSKKVLM